MKVKSKKILAVVIAFVIVVSAFASCSSPTKSVVGEWYNYRDKCLDIRSDGTWKLEGSYGSGTYKLLDDGETFEFTDFYGDTHESPVEEDEYGEYIDFGYYGNFYRDEYPEEIEDDNDDYNGNSSNDKYEDDKYNSDKEDEGKLLDAFKGISFEVSGISPYCKIAVNNSECDEEIQGSVAYSFDKEYYANGETVIVTAKKIGTASSKDFELKETKFEYKIENQPEYISSLNGVDTKLIEDELDDWITSNVAKAVKSGQEGWAAQNLLGCNLNVQLLSVSDIKQGDVYFVSLKKNKISQSHSCFNMLMFTYSAAYKGKFGSGHVYCSISACNIIKYPDGTIKWGTKNEDAFDFTAEGTTKGMEHCVQTTVMRNSENYNISKI